MQKQLRKEKSLNKEFERCCTFLAEMMEKYGLLVMQDILEELHYDPETWGYKFVAKTHRLAYGMKATYTFYLSFA